MYQNIKLDIDEGVALITLNNPKKLNALSSKLLEEIGDVLDRVKADNNVRAIVIWGGEKLFGAGADIAEVGRIGRSYDAYLWSRGIQEMFNRIENFPKATVAAIGGIALGGCLEMALSCDLRIASMNAKIGFPEINLGTIPGAGGTQRLPRLIGVPRAKEMFLTGESISAQEAHRLGIVNRVVADGTLLEESQALAQQIARKAPIALTMVKSAVNVGIEMDIEKGLEHEAKCFGILFNTDDLHEGSSAFLEKRKANFKGK